MIVIIDLVLSVLSIPTARSLLRESTALRMEATWSSNPRVNVQSSTIAILRLTCGLLNYYYYQSS